MSGNRSSPGRKPPSVNTRNVRETPRCQLCQQPATQAERNVDGTYLHDACAAAVTPIFASKGPKGGGIYA